MIVPATSGYYNNLSKVSRYSDSTSQFPNFLANFRRDESNAKNEDAEKGNCKMKGNERKLLESLGISLDRSNDATEEESVPLRSNCSEYKRE